MMDPAHRAEPVVVAVDLVARLLGLRLLRIRGTVVVRRPVEGAAGSGRHRDQPLGADLARARALLEASDTGPHRGRRAQSRTVAKVPTSSNPTRA